MPSVVVVITVWMDMAAATRGLLSDRSGRRPSSIGE
jgi:hypothetical protein